MKKEFVLPNGKKYKVFEGPIEMEYRSDRYVDNLVALEIGEYEDIIYQIVSIGTHPCAYIGFPEGHVFYFSEDKSILKSGLSKSSQKLNTTYDLFQDVYVHGGFTYSRLGDNKDGLLFSNKFFWIGWDYAHSGDYVGYMEKFKDLNEVNARKWTLDEIREHAFDAIEQLKQLMNDNNYLIDFRLAAETAIEESLMEDEGIPNNEDEEIDNEDV